MSDNTENPFAQDWRDCLEIHYQDVIRRNDTLTEETLTQVMYDVGYREDALRQIKLHATMRTEDLAEDFVPNLDIPPVRKEPKAHAGVDVPSADAIEADVPDEVEIPEAKDDDSDNPDPNAPKQISMF